MLARGRRAAGLTKWAGLSARTAQRRRPAQTIADWFTVRRGIATAANEFFIVDEQRVADLNLPREFLRPMLPSPRSLPVNEVLADADGLPLVAPRRFLVSCPLPLHEIDELQPSLGYYLRCSEEALAQRALCRMRNPWYAQEEPEPPPFLCNYMARPSDLPPLVVLPGKSDQLLVSLPPNWYHWQ